MEIGGLMRLCANIRDIERSLGDGIKRLYPAELSARQKLRRVASAQPEPAADPLAQPPTN